VTWDVKPVEWIDATPPSIRLLDQTRLPHEVAYIDCLDTDRLCEAIRTLAVRGAPLLGVVAAYGMALAAHVSIARNEKGIRRDLRLAGGELAATRPTAVNIAWAVERVRERVEPAGSVEEARALALRAAREIEGEDRASCEAIAADGQRFVPDGARVLTHCNTGRICTAGIGTALGVVHAAHEAGRDIHVWVDETRPLLQGARLTAWELQRAGVPMTLVVDSVAPSLMADGKVDLVIVGADRICANGDFANKIGTYGLALAANHHRIPFYVAAPASSIDLGTASGDGIEIEQRDPDEVTSPLGAGFAAAGTAAANPAFDVTPHDLVTAIVTDEGVVQAPFGPGLRDAVRGRGK
jgi:methylthioribose-1-phosphate isomerase